MNKYFITLFLLVASTLFLLMASTLLPSSADGLLIFKPPKLGAPATRIGAGTRGISLGMPQLEALAPQQTGLTSRSEPVLYWYLSEVTQQVIEFSLIKEGIDEPLIEKNLLPIVDAGLQSIHLTDYGIPLQPEEEYRWSIAIIKDVDQRSKDIIASATIKYQPLNEPLSDVKQLAEAGYWYEALQILIESHSPLVNDFLKQADLIIPPL